MSQPMNMGDWQSQMKAQKDAERKKKVEAAQGLRSHNAGVNEEELKLKALKEEERKKKVEATESLRTHKAGVNEEELKLSALRAEERKKNLDAEQHLHSYRGNEPVETKARPARPDAQYPAPEAINKQEVQVSPGSVSAMAGKFNAVPEVKEVATGPVLEEKKTGDDEAENEPNQLYSTVVRLDVLFSFGLVTTAMEPSFGGYTQAVEEIVRETLQSNSELAERCSYDATFGPFVKDCVPDETYVDPDGRQGVKRFVATMAVPVFLANGVSLDTARDGVITGLQDAIQEGRFLTLAQEGN